MRGGAGRRVYLFLSGSVMGAADVVPGVSGGTMAFILGIYGELIETIKAFNLDLARMILRGRWREGLRHVNFSFLLPLLLGLATALLSLAHVVSWLLEHHPVPLYALFFGLVAASILAVSTHVGWGAARFLALVTGAIAAYLVVGLVPLEMPHTPLMLFASGAVAICAMILPGISGSFLLLILGQYEFVIGAVRDLSLPALVPFAAGMVCGIGVFSRLLSWLLRRHHQLTVTLLIGFMLGSLRRIWPFKCDTGESNVLPDVTQRYFWLSLSLCLLGFLAISFLDQLRSRKNPVARLFAMSRLSIPPRQS